MQPSYNTDPAPEVKHITSVGSLSDLILDLSYGRVDSVTLLQQHWIQALVWSYSSDVQAAKTLTL